MAFTRDVMIRLPGPNRGGDTWGMQWTEPGVVSPGSVEVRAQARQRFPNGDAMIELDGKRRRFQPDDDLATDYTYKFTGKVKHNTIAAIKTAVAAHASSSNTDLARIANIVTKILEDDITQQDIDAMVSVMSKPSRPDDKINSMMLLAIISINEL